MILTGLYFLFLYLYSRSIGARSSTPTCPPWRGGIRRSNSFAHGQERLGSRHRPRPILPRHRRKEEQALGGTGTQTIRIRVPRAVRRTLLADAPRIARKTKTTMKMNGKRNPTTMSCRRCSCIAAGSSSSAGRGSTGRSPTPRARAGASEAA